MKMIELEQRNEILLAYFKIKKIRKYILEENTKRYYKKKLPLNNEELLKKIKQYIDKNFTPKELNKYNYYLQKNKWKKYKESHYFSINDYMGSTEEFYNFKNFKEWTLKNWEFQKESFYNGMIQSEEYNRKNKEEHFSKTVEEEAEEKTIEQFGRKYETLYLNHYWCRWVEYKRIMYGDLISIETFFLELLEEEITKKIDEAYPSIYVHPTNKMFSKIENSEDFTLNIEKKTCENEEELELAEQDKYLFCFKYTKKILPEILELTKDKTFSIIKDKLFEGDDEIVQMIFPTIELVEKISTENFLDDFNKYLQPKEYLLKKIKPFIEKGILEFSNIYLNGKINNEKQQTLIEFTSDEINNFKMPKTMEEAKKRFSL
jgi:hypothetical protein